MVTVLSRDVSRASRLLVQSATAPSDESGSAPAALGPMGEGLPRLRIARWDPTSEKGANELTGCDAVVHLAGSPAVGQRWNPRVKREIRDSRVLTTRWIVDALARAESRPRTFICASAVGYYGARDGSEELDEDAACGTDFLASVCDEWEAAAARATRHGLRVVHARIGLVLAPRGGALERMVKPFKAFAGGPLGSGRQVVSWVHLDDLVRALLMCLDDESLAGPVNLTAPEPVTNATLASEIGRVLHRPAWIPVPAAALRLRFGEGADPLLTGQRVLPRRLQAAGFQWRFADVRSALEDLLG